MINNTIGFHDEQSVLPADGLHSSDERGLGPTSACVVAVVFLSFLLPKLNGPAVLPEYPHPDRCRTCAASTPEARANLEASLIAMGAIEARPPQMVSIWIEDRLQELSEIVAVSVCGFSVMDNQLLVLAPFGPETANSWSSDEVVKRGEHVDHLRMYPTIATTAASFSSDTCACRHRPK